MDRLVHSKGPPVCAKVSVEVPRKTSILGVGRLRFPREKILEDK